MPVSISGTSGITFPDGSLQTAAASPLVLRNRIINGDMRIDQRNAGASTTPSASNTYNLDRWVTEFSQVSKLTVQQNYGSVTPPAGFTNYLGIKVAATATVGAGDYFVLEQRIEGFNTADLAWGTASAKTVTLSFWVYSNTTGTFGGNIQNTGARNYPFSYTISVANTWEQKTITIPGDTSGTWATGNTLGINIYFSLGTGTTYSGAANTWATGPFLSTTGATSIMGSTSNYWYVTGVQLEQNTSATPFERRLYNQELANCQRYYEIFTQNANATAILSAVLVGANNWLNVFYKQTKRATPTVTAPSGWVNATPGIFPSIDNCSIGGGMAYFYLAGTGTILTVSAEL